MQCVMSKLSSKFHKTKIETYVMLSDFIRYIYQI